MVMHLCFNLSFCYHFDADTNQLTHGGGDDPIIFQPDAAF